MLPEHLGGQNAGNVDTGLIKSLRKRLGIASLVDIGCGDGTATRIYAGLGLDVTGVDGDWTRLPDDSRFVQHDFTQGPLLAGPFDLAYSVEFLEHLEERYLENVMPLFAACQYAVVTAAPPGKNGHHHVNCRPPRYWKQVFADYGMAFDGKMTRWLRIQSTMCKATGGHAGKPFKAFREWGMFFCSRS